MSIISGQLGSSIVGSSVLGTLEGPVTGSVITITFSDSYTLSDAINAQNVNAFTNFALNDSITFTESINPALQVAPLVAELFNDTLSFDDGLVVAQGIPIPLSDSITFSDALSLRLDISITFSDAITFSDTFTQVANIALPLLGDFISMTDNFTTGSLKGMEFSDQLGNYLDEILLLLTPGLELPLDDSITFSDALSLVVGSTIYDLGVRFCDQLTLTDSFSYSVTNSSPSGPTVAYIVLNDHLSLTDSINLLQPPSFNTYIRRYLNDVLQ